MNNVSNRALVNFVVDTAIAVAFVVSAVSGLVFLLPAEWLTRSASSTTALGVEYASWRTLHDWTAVIMIAGVTLHTVLHWRWVTTMLRRLAGGRRAQAAPAGAAAVPAPSASRASAAHAASSPAREHLDAAPRGSAVRDGLTRDAFLKRAGAVGAAALVGGLVGRSAAISAVGWLDDGSSTSSASPTTPVTQDSTQTVSSAARVTIDAGRCTGCGRCLQVCPFGAFAASESAVVVSDAEACRLCGRCTQVCQVGAITLDA